MGMSLNLENLEGRRLLTTLNFNPIVVIERHKLGYVGTNPILGGNQNTFGSAAVASVASSTQGHQASFDLTVPSNLASVEASLNDFLSSMASQNPTDFPA